MQCDGGDRVSVARVAGGLKRRWRRAWTCLARGRRAPAAEGALTWLLRAGSGEGVRESRGDAAPCPALTGAAIETALACGCREEAAHWARWLVSVQGADGAVGASECCGPAMVSTAWAARALLAIARDEPEFEREAVPAARRLRAWVGDDGRLLTPWADKREVAGGVPPDVGPLAAAGARWPETDWAKAAARVMDHWLGAQRRDDPDDNDTPLYLAEAGALARCAEICLQTGRATAAEELLRRAEAAQRQSGAVREHWRHGPVLCRSVARLATAWYRAGRRDLGDRAVEYLERSQATDGGFPRRGGWAGLTFGARRDAWAARFYLDAALMRVRAAFEADWRRLPETIDPDDGRARAARAWCESMVPGTQVADAGCGRGRFLRLLAGWFPRLRFTGIDLVPAMLEQLPQGVERLEASLLHVPAASGAFDAAMAVESVEHALLPERAVAELCRLVRPGGRVLVIDKDRCKQALSEHEPWERWCAPEELAAWLSRWCDDVQVARVPHREGRPADDLFLAASGVRRGAGGTPAPQRGGSGIGFKTRRP